MITLKAKQELILRHYREGHSLRKISRDLGLNRKTVTRYIRDYSDQLFLINKGEANLVFSSSLCAAPRYDTSNRGKRKITESLLEEVRYHLDENRKKRLSGRRKQQLKKIDILELLHDQGYSIGYTTLCKLMRDLEKEAQEAFIRQSYKPGEICEFDWGEVKIDVGNGIEKFQLAVFTSAYSNYRFAYLFNRQDTLSFQQAHVHFFNHVQGVFKKLVYDNMRVVIKKFVGPSAKQATDGLLKLSMYYQFDYRFCNIRKGNEKGHVERSVEYVRRKAFGFQDTFESLEAANVYLQEVCDRLNARAQKSCDNRSALEMFAEEKDNLFPHRESFICCDEHSLKVTPWSTVRFGSNHYSIPEMFVGKIVDIRVSPEHIVCIANGSVVCTHKRIYRLNKWSLQLEHYTQTLKRKPGALSRSVAFSQIDSRLQKIFHTYFTENPKEFVELIEYLKRSQHSIDTIEAAILKLKPIRPEDISLDRIKIVCDFEHQPPHVQHEHSEIDDNCAKQLAFVSQFFLSPMLSCSTGNEVES